MTATVTNGQPGGQIQVSVIYADTTTTTNKIWLWRDQSKTQRIALTNMGNGVFSGTLPDYPMSTFYVEGLYPSKDENDITLRVSSQGAKDEEALTVTPVVQSFKTTIPTPSMTFEAALQDPTVVDGSFGLRAAKPAATPDSD